MVHQRNWIIVAVVVFTLIAFIPFAQAEPPLKEGNPGLPGCLAEVAQLQEEINTLKALLDAMKNYAPVPQTGVTKCYDPYSVAEIPCANTGQDGDLQKGIVSPVPRFTDNNNGTVTDNLTGLVWMKNAHFWDPMHWGSALSTCNQLADDGTYLTDGSQPGDWRLPNLKEVISLMDFGNLDPTLPTGHPFIKVWGDSYWTSTTFPYELGLEYLVMYSRGYIGAVSRGACCSLVWCVR